MTKTQKTIAQSAKRSLSLHELQQVCGGRARRTSGATGNSSGASSGGSSASQGAGSTGNSRRAG